MARSSSKARAGRPRRSSGGRGGRRVVLAGRGDGWELWVPEDVWAGMTEAERAAMAERQAALLERGGGRPPRRAAGAGLDQVTTGRPAQPSLFG